MPIAPSESRGAEEAWRAERKREDIGEYFTPFYNLYALGRKGIRFKKNDEERIQDGRRLQLAAFAAGRLAAAGSEKADFGYQQVVIVHRTQLQQRYPKAVLYGVRLL